MTTTKKKAKARTLAQRVTELEAWQKGERMRGDHFAGRITALEQAQRPAEKPAKFDCGVMRDDCGCAAGTCALKPAAEKRAGPWVDFGVAGGNRANAGVVGHLVCGVGPANAVGGWWRAWAVNADGQATHWWGTQYATEAAARAACDAELVRLGWTLEDPPAPAATPEESRLRDAVVDAALEHLACDHDPDEYCGHAHGVLAAARDLRAHRAKKGGA